MDEVFKANSAILNALLTLLNEREFDNGSARRPVPLVSVVGASNEVPDDEALLAFYDRFLLRVPVVPVSDAAFDALLTLPTAAAAVPAQPITSAERAAILVARDAIPLADDALAALRSLRTWLAAGDGSAPSDRRWRQLVGLLRVAAASEGRPCVDALDLWLAPYVMAAEPGDAAGIERWFVAQVAQSAPLDAAWLARAVQAFERQLDIEQRLPAVDDAAGTSEGAGKLALAQSLGGDDDAGGDALASMRFVAAALEARQRRRFSPLHVAARRAQVAEARERAQAARDAVQAQHAAMQAQLECPTVVAAVVAPARARRPGHDARRARRAVGAARQRRSGLCGTAGRRATGRGRAGAGPGMSARGRSKALIPERTARRRVR